MCGRARCTLRADDIPRACHRNDGPVRTVHMDRYRPSYNVSPGHNFPVVRREDGGDGDGVVLHCMIWGLVPSFTKKTEKPDHYKMFNARSESIYEKASFRRLVPKSRCLVVVEGFYEWKKDGPKKQPYYIHFKDGRPLVFAALYDSWENSEDNCISVWFPAGEILSSFTILTSSSSSALRWLHDRMPVILGDKGSINTWLNCSSSSKFDDVLKPYEDPDLVWYPVTPAMGKSSFDGPECIKEIQMKSEGNNLISKFFSKKGIKEEQESTIEEKNSSAETFRTDPTKSLKRETDTEDNTAISSITDKGGQDSKSITIHSEDDATAKCQVKRDYEAFKAGLEPMTDNTVKQCSTPARKKGNVKSAGDKQPTLLSYFGKN
ncbi:abasic site processing protein YoqW isoform X3 [Juglans regia]|uniref:Abasic site processing protein YoqW isoform X3 n=1 Tax=Juglans regia TaxID=51240 RepID=A0A6P9E1S4_JUGRE|nr:abasic site processing protein YoqW isoform X3 [Juglans regia]